MRLIKLSALFGTALLLLGCFPPTTTHPVGTTAGLANDPTLTGLWRGKMESSDTGRDVYFHFLPTADGTITVVLVQAGTEPDGDWSVASITTATLGTNHFMNAHMVMSNGKPEDEDETASGTVPLLYRADAQGRLVLFFLDEDAVKAAIKAHQIAGTVEEGQFGDAKITADPKALDAFMASRKGIALYGERFATLIKIE
jgi:hypothetical protein